MVRLSQITKRFGIAPPALDAVSGSIRGGEITGLVGPDGAGKSTLIRIMTGLMLPDKGTVEVLGFDARRDPARIQAAIGYMPQRFGLYEDLSVQENLDLYADLRGLPKPERPAAFDRLLTLTDLKRFTSRLAGKLSGGMKQKLGLACALLKKPRLLLLDEPSVGVDPISRRELWKMVEDLTKEGIGVVWSTAYLDEAEACDRVFLFNHGKLLFTGAPSELTSRVDGRVFKLTGMKGRRRPILAKAARPARGDRRGHPRRRDPPRPRAGRQGPDCSGRGRRRRGNRWLRRRPGSRTPSSTCSVAVPAVDRSSRRLSLRAQRTRRSQSSRRAALLSALATSPLPKTSASRFRAGRFSGCSDRTAPASPQLSRCCAGSSSPPAGKDVSRVSIFAAIARRLAIASGTWRKTFSLYGDLNVTQNLEFFAGVYGLSGARKHERIGLMKEIFDFGRHSAMSSKDLPLGLKQRLALACAVMHEPEVLFLDEPTSGVDPITRREFWTHINALVEKGVAVLVTTHFMDEAEYCDRISLIYRGHSIAIGSPDELKASVANARNPDPTMEDAFIALVQGSEAKAAA